MKRNVIAHLAAFALLVSAVGAQDTIFETDGDLGPGDTLGSDGSYQDLHLIGVTATTTIQVVVESNDFDAYVEALLPGERQIHNDDFDGWNAGFIHTVERSGTMQLTVRSVFGSSGKYRLVVQRVTQARDLQVGTTLSGRLGGDSEFGTQAWFALAGRKGQRIAIDLISDDFDPFLELIDASGRRHSDDDGGAGHNSRLVYTFADDQTITVVARALFGETAGAFELSVRESSRRLRDSISGSLSAIDQRAYDGTIFDRVEVEVAEGESLSFVLRSQAFDSHLWLSDPDGVNIADNDDSDGGSDSTIDIRAERAGTYTLFVTAFFDKLGDWELDIYEHAPD